MMMRVGVVAILQWSSVAGMVLGQFMTSYYCIFELLDECHVAM